MRTTILDAERPSELARWKALWQAWPRRDVMANPEYVRLFARPGERAVCAVGEEPSATILMPLVLRPIAAEPWAPPGEARWDASSPYGYGGPFTFGDGFRDDAAFWDAYEAFCREARIVSTFLRLSLFPDELATVRGRVEDRGPNVVRSLAPRMDAVWDDYDPRARTNVRFAQRAGLRAQVDVTGASLDAFLGIYHHTMTRRAADPWYHFPRSFFERLVEALPGQFAFTNVGKDGEVLSSELVLIGATRLYGFLGGTRAEAFPLRPNDLVRHAQVVFGVERGFEALVLGGGKASGDGILRHKLHLAPRGVVPFRVAALVHDADACDALFALRERHDAAAGRTFAPPDDFFPRYRG